MLKPELIAPPDDTPISLEEAKAHCRVDTADSDELITGLIDAAVSFLDGPSGILGRCLISQTWLERFDPYSREHRRRHESHAYQNWLRLSLAPVTDIVVINYIDVAGTDQLIDPANYALDADEFGNFVRFVPTYTLPALSTSAPAVRVTYVAGYGVDPEDVPAAARQAMKLLVGDWYLSRETMQEGRLAQLPFAVDALLGPLIRSYVA